MSNTNEEVLRQVQKELQARPNIPDGILFALATQIDPSLDGMDPRTFHAHYVVPARAAVNPGKRRKRKPRPSTRAAATTPRRAQASRVRRPVETPSPAVEPILVAAPVVKTEPAPPAATAAPPQPPEAIDAGPEPLPDSVSETGTGAVVTTAAEPQRERVRAALFAFALELAAADRAVHLVDVFLRIDHFVDRVTGDGV